MSSLGDKIQFFRNRSQKSQLDLELKINASPGSLSRIERENVNPTKETLDKITEILELTTRERSFLDGPFSKLLTEKVIEKALVEVGEYFSKESVFAYLVDEGFNLVTVSKGFMNFLRFREEDLTKFFLKNLFEILLHEEFNLIELIDERSREDVILNLISRYLVESEFMIGTPHREIFYNLVQSNSQFAKLYEIALKEKIPYSSLEKRKVKFNIGGNIVDSFYSNEVLVSNSRFEVVEYNF